MNEYEDNKLKVVIHYDLDPGTEIGLNWELERELEQVLKNYGYSSYGSGSGFGVRDLEYIKEQCIDTIQQNYTLYVIIVTT